MQKERLSVEQINRAVRENPAKLVEQAEHAYRAKLCSLADSLCGAPAPVKVLMLSGPSGSGKTTTANLLKDELCRRGHDATVVSLDYFFYEKDRYPRKPDGSCDYENVSAIDREKLFECFRAVWQGETYRLHPYDFSTQSYRKEYQLLNLGKNGTMIVEGIHALNPLLYQDMPQDRLKRLYVCVEGGYVDEEGRETAGAELRLMRRLSRDFLYRGASADKTAAMWQDVLEGEKQYLNPFRSLADDTLNTFHSFEAPLLKPYVLKALEGSRSEQGLSFAGKLRTFLTELEELSLEELPESSLLREFVPGGLYEHLY